MTRPMHLRDRKLKTCKKLACMQTMGSGVVRALRASPFTYQRTELILLSPQNVIESWPGPWAAGWPGPRAEARPVQDPNVYPIWPDRRPKLSEPDQRSASGYFRDNLGSITETSTSIGITHVNERTKAKRNFYTF